MPSIAAHMVMAKIVGDILGIEDEEFIRGNLFPDVTIEPDSHHKIQGTHFMIPDMDYFKQNLFLGDNFELGYYTHLLLDKHFLEEYVPNNISNLDVFENGVIYHEYDMINAKLLENFGIDADEYTSILDELYSHPNINENKLNKNIACLNNKKASDTEYLDVDDFSVFLDDVAYQICEEIKDACKRYRMSLCPRK